MCGILGAYGFEGLDESIKPKLEQSLSLLTKRGPDHNHCFFTNKVGLGHTRLSIIDTSEKGNQPLTDRTGKHTIIYNGEVYNFREIKKELLDKGYQFHSETDTEVVLNSFIEWGPKCLDRFNGFFAFAIYSEEDHALFLARDRYGIKPLLYAYDDHRIVFGSELKALLRLTGEKEIDVESLNLYFQLTYIPSAKTICSNIHKLEPGHFLITKDGEVQKHQYYRIPESTMSPMDGFEVAQNNVRSLLESSVEKRLVADVPLGTFLSGGIDSSIITAIAARKVEKLSTFSIGFQDNAFFDETHYAELLAKKHNTDHHTFKLSNEDLYAHLHDVIDYLDEPFADSSAIPVYILSKLTRQHITVALSGDGADEVFGGYNKHAAWIMLRKLGLSNTLVKHFGGVASTLPQSRSSKLNNWTRQVDKYRKALSLSDEKRYWFLAQFISQEACEKLLNKEYYLNLSDYSTERFNGNLDHDLNAVLRQDMSMVLEGDMLRKIDSMSMANSLEVRVPFLDHELVDYVFRLQEDYKIKGKHRKYILKEAFKEDLPDELYGRGKHGFEVPLLQWFRSELSGELNVTVFNRELIESLGFFQWPEVHAIQKRLHSPNPGDVHIQVWQLYVFVNWWKRYID